MGSVPDTLTASTGGGGQHLLYAHPAARSATQPEGCPALLGAAGELDPNLIADESWGAPVRSVSLGSSNHAERTLGGNAASSENALRR